MFALNKALSVRIKNERERAWCESVGNPFLWPQNIEYRKSFVCVCRAPDDIVYVYIYNSGQTESTTLLPFECHLLVTEGELNLMLTLGVASSSLSYALRERKGQPLCVSGDVHQHSHNLSFCAQHTMLGHYSQRQVNGSAYLLFFPTNGWFVELVFPSKAVSIIYF